MANSCFWGSKEHPGAAAVIYKANFIKFVTIPQFLCLEVHSPALRLCLAQDCPLGPFRDRGLPSRPEAVWPAGGSRVPGLLEGDCPVLIPSVPVAAAARFAAVGERAPLSPCAHSPPRPRPGASQHNPHGGPGGGGGTEVAVGGLVAPERGWYSPTASSPKGQGQGLEQVGKLG